MNFSNRLRALLIGTAVMVVQPQVAVALSPTQVSGMAKEFTVLIGGDGIGSGVIFERKGNTYYVLTNRHVVPSDGRYEIQTPDNSRFVVSRSQELPGLDLAVLQFTSNKNYRVANLGNSDQISEGMTVYVVGWADALPGITNERSYQFTDGNIRSRLQNAKDGYALVYNNEAIPGMSGGPVLDENGRVVGINGRAFPERNTGTIVRLGIPVNSFLIARKNPQPVAPTQTATRQRSAEDFISLGGAKAQKKDYQGAIADYNQALRINPNNPDAYFRRGFAHFQQENFPAAIQDFSKVLQISPQNGTAYAMRSSIYLTQRNVQGALADGEQAVRVAPNFNFSYLTRGNARVFSQDYQGGIADIDRFIQEDPSSAYAYSIRGLARAQLGDKPGANADFDRAIQRDPNLFSIYQFRGISRALVWGEKQAGIADLQKAADLAQKQGSRFLYQDIQKTIRLAQNPASGSKEALIEPFTQAIAKNPNDANAYFYRAAGYLVQGDKQLALADLNQATRLNPKSSVAWVARGDVLNQLGRNTEAIASYSFAIQANNQWGESSLAKTYTARGATYQLLGNTKAAIADFNQVIRLEPNNYWLRGLSSHFQKDYQGALVAYEKAIAQDPKSFTAVNNVGLVKYEQGDVSGAMRQFQAAININRESPEPQFALAVALYAKGERERGLKMAEAALRLDNSFRGVEFLKKNLWGDKLIADTKKLLENPKIRAIISSPSR